MLSSTVQNAFYVGNNSTVVSYAVPFTYLDATHVKVSRLDAGTGTVAVVAGVATFSSAQSTLFVGSHVRIAGTTYTIDTRTSTTAFTFTQIVTLASSAFTLPDDAVSLVSGSTFTLIGVSGAATITTNPAVAATGLVRIYREVPLTQLTDLPATGPVPTAEIESALDLVTMQVQQLATQITNAGVIVPTGQTTTSDTTTFANAAGRAAAAPTRIGQQGVQLDTGVEYYGTATTAGSWSLTSTAGAQYHASTVTGLTPAFVGQLAVIGSGASAGDTYTVWMGTATTTGAWTATSPRYTPFSWQWTGWAAGEPLVAGQRRWVGNTSMHIYGISEAFISCDTAGTTNAVVKVHLVDTGVELTTSSITLTPALVGSALLDTELTPDAGDTQLQRSRVEVEIVSVGTTFNVTSTAGSTAVTPSVGDLTGFKTGSRVASNVASGVRRDVFVVKENFDGSVIFSHMATATGSAPVVSGGILQVRGMAVTLAGGVTNITGVLAADTALIRPGDFVVGDTVTPGTVVETVSATSFTINNPLTGATTFITTLGAGRPGVRHFANISEAAAQTSIQIGTAVTSGIKVGDSVHGLYVPASTYITVVNANDFTISAAISGGTATEITVIAPVRVATVTAGAFTASLSNTVGMMVGRKVTGPGVPPDTFVTAVASPVITVNNELATALAGASTDLFEFTRDLVQVTGTTVLLSNAMTLPYAVNTTDIAVGMNISGTGILAGTTVSSVAGSIVTMSQPPSVAGAAQSFRFTSTVSQWTGLQLTLNGYMSKISLASPTL